MESWWGKVDVNYAKWSKSIPKAPKKRKEELK